MNSIEKRFRKFLPVVIDVETAGLNAATDALLELACVFITMNESLLIPTETIHHHIVPFEDANLEPASLKFNNIDPFHPFRFAISEHDSVPQSHGGLNRPQHSPTPRIRLLHGQADGDHLALAVERESLLVQQPVPVVVQPVR